MKILKLFLLVISILSFSCATIIKGSNQKIFVTSSPSEANIKVKDQDGNNVITTASPATLTLQQGNGFFRSASYSIEISKQGYATQYVTLTGGLNGWYLLGNLVVGGLIGWLIVDPISGAMWTLSPEYVNTTLAAENKQTAINNTSVLQIVLIEDVSENVKSQMIKIK